MSRLCMDHFYLIPLTGQPSGDGSSLSDFSSGLEANRDIIYMMLVLTAGGERELC